MGQWVSILSEHDRQITCHNTCISECSYLRKGGLGGGGLKEQNVAVQDLSCCTVVVDVLVGPHILTSFCGVLWA